MCHDPVNSNLKLYFQERYVETYTSTIILLYATAWQYNSVLGTSSLSSDISSLCKCRACGSGINKRSLQLFIRQSSTLFSANGQWNTREIALWYINIHIYNISITFMIFFTPEACALSPALFLLFFIRHFWRAHQINLKGERERSSISGFVHFTRVLS